MTSNDTKKKARRLQQENPGMKYTEALRRAEAEAARIFIGRSLEDGKPVFFDLRTPQHEVCGIPREKSVTKASESLKSAESQGVVILDEWHDLRTSGESQAVLDTLARLARPRPRFPRQSISDLTRNPHEGSLEE